MYVNSKPPPPSATHHTHIPPFYRLDRHPFQLKLTTSPHLLSPDSCIRTRSLCVRSTISFVVVVVVVVLVVGGPAPLCAAATAAAAWRREVCYCVYVFGYPRPRSPRPSPLTAPVNTDAHRIFERGYCCCCFRLMSVMFFGRYHGFPPTTTS